MDTTIDEIANGIYRLSAFNPAVAGIGMTFNRFHVLGEEPVSHPPPRHVPERSRRPVAGDGTGAAPLDHFGHYESDECGARDGGEDGGAALGWRVCRR